MKLFVALQDAGFTINFHILVYPTLARRLQIVEISVENVDNYLHKKTVTNLCKPVFRDCLTSDRGMFAVYPAEQADNKVEVSGKLFAGSGEHRFIFAADYNLLLEDQSAT